MRHLKMPVYGFCFVMAATCLFFISCQSKKADTLFESLSSDHTHIGFVNKPAKHELFNILYFLYYYNGGGVATGDINNDGLMDIYFTANSKAGNKLYLNKGDFQFEDITDKAGVAGAADWNTGVTMADVNGDGWLDIYVSTISNKYGLTGHNELYINKGNGSFSEESARYGLNTSCLTTQSVFFDYDRDGDLDCYILNQSHRPHANITDTIFRRNYDSLSGDRLYRNDIGTSGRFTDVSAAAGIYQSSLGYGLGIAIGDLNNDGWDDIYVGNDFHENDYYYVNNGDGRFTESGARHFKHYSRFSMGNDVADYNNDGQLDVITVDMLPYTEKVLKTYGSDENPDVYRVKLDMHGYQKQYSRNCLQRNNGNGSSFSETALISGIAATDWSWAPLFADFDNDGNKDLFVSSGIVRRPVDLDYIRFVSDLAMKGGGESDKFDDIAIDRMPEGSSHPFFYKGDGVLKFTDVSHEWGAGDMKGFYNGASYADLDNDGNLDMVINCIDAPAVVLKNKAPVKSVMNIHFKGSGLNTSGIGAKAWVFAAGKVQYQQLMLTRGFQSSCEPRLHFGLDSLRYMDSVLIVWPDQRYQVLKNVPATGRLEVRQSEAGGVFDYGRYFPPSEELFENITAQAGVRWSHRENDFVDYNKQYLIPHQLSTRGPKLAVADVNKDGLDDLYVCGASGQAGQLMVQQRSGAFIASDTAVFAAALASEEVDAAFFDANNDGWPDLYVVSGGNEYSNGSQELADHLYLNDGKGHFSQAANAALPELLVNKSCVSAADIDKDGDTDLFVGGLADPEQYGMPQSSWLLLNDGKGSFRQAAASVIRLDAPGMVTGACFTDFNNDGWPDLAIAGEWMPVQLFINKNGVFGAADIASSTGLWQTLYAMDVNGDGYKDVLAGNWGHNSKLYAGKSGPLKLYVKDFDKNGSVEQVMAYTIDGEEYPFLAKDELERSLPVLKKAYLEYSLVAGKTVKYLLYDLFKDYTELKAETLGSACFINDGKGNFKKMELPDELQLSPVFAFASRPDGKSASLFAAGNFYGTIPYEGRYDAQLPVVFSFDPAKSGFKVAGIPGIDGEVRDAKWIRAADGSLILVIARNSDGLIFLKPRNQ